VSVDPRAAVEAVWRIESARVVATLARLVRDVGVAEELAQDALVAALEQWPASGTPRNPGAWLTAVGKRRAIDHLRRQERLARKLAELEGEVLRTGWTEDADLAAVGEERIDDDLLRLVLITCHPVLSTEAQVALTLRLVGGLRTEEIARAFLVATPTVAQRITRAKRTLTEARVPFELPPREEWPDRLAAVLHVVYLIFNEGYTATSGADWMRPQLCEDALRLGRILAGLVPVEAEVHGLVALMELQASRIPARTAADGSPVLLLDQRRARWDHLLIRRGLAALARAEVLGGGLGPYGLQAAIAACHARAPVAEATDWPRIVALYDALAQLSPSPVVELNRAVAVSMAFGPAAALELVDALAEDQRLAGYHLLPSVRADLLERLGRLDEAAAAYQRAAAMTDNEAERAVLRAKAAACS
jgi:RNA polymerase sigma-70 factor, ECF subfamily